jgi:hypothetical protein
MQIGPTKTLHESTTRRVIVGDILQGEILTDLGLAAQFDTGRTPVRETIVTQISLDDPKSLSVALAQY